MEGNSPNNHEVDLPLSANYSEAQVEHFILDLVCDMNERILHGKITLFLRGIQYDKDPDSYSIPQLKLDCFGLSVTQCSSFELDEEDQQLCPHSEENSNNGFRLTKPQLKRYAQLYSKFKDEKTQHELEFELKKHFLDIKVPHLSSWEKTVIVIHFKTQPEGPSLMWTNNQDGRPCVFTIGDAFNNRSLFPSQDMPQAMATWHCNVTIPHQEYNSNVQVLMTGEAEPRIYYDENGDKVFPYSSSYRMPASTFALAIGPWSCHVFNLNASSISEDVKTTSGGRKQKYLPRCRIHSPDSLSSEAITFFTKYLSNCFASIASVLEPYPFQRLDILIAPDCFDSLGLACPNLLILSQSLLSSDLSMFQRVSHEICHTWFGILLGPRNWTEDWLTEGMCCYLEDIVHARAMQWSEQEMHDRNKLKAFLKYNLLKSELEYIPSSLQRLRPDGEITAEQAKEQSCVKNGIRSETAHVHYMKGFFLLKLLEETAGQDSLLSAVNRFIIDYKGKLFSSQEILEFFFSHCPNLRSSTLGVSSLCQDWLDSPGLPLVLQSFPYSIDANQLYQQVVKEFETIKRAPTRKRTHKEFKETQHHSNVQEELLDSIQKFLPDQVLLLLNLILENPATRMSQQVMSSLRDKYSIIQTNAEVQHAWCELVIQQRCKSWYGDVERFLLQHRAMGLYLYGELMISEDAALQAIAHKCYHHNSGSMPRAVRKELREILGIEGDGESIKSSERGRGERSETMP